MRACLCVGEGVCVRVGERESVCVPHVRERGEQVLAFSFGVCLVYSHGMRTSGGEGGGDEGDYDDGGDEGDYDDGGDEGDNSGETISYLNP